MPKPLEVNDEVLRHLEQLDLLCGGHVLIALAAEPLVSAAEQLFFLERLERVLDRLHAAVVWRFLIEIDL